jgi:7-carboxy-7-deazaguanine synthase
MPPAELARWIVDANLPVRLQIQAHKYIWSPETRGV